MASLETIITLTGENLGEDSEVWVDGSRAKIISAMDGRLRFTLPFTEIPEAWTASVTVVSGQQTSNVHHLRLVPPGTVDTRDTVGLLGYVRGGVRIDATPGKERLLLLDRRNGLFEFDRASRTAKPWLPLPGPGEGTAIARRDSDGTVFLATYVAAGLVEIFAIDEGKNLRQVALLDFDVPITQMAASSDALFFAVEDNCSLHRLSADVELLEVAVTIPSCNAIGGLATNSDSLFVSVQHGASPRIEQILFSDLEGVENSWPLGDTGALVATDDYVVVRTSNRLAEIKAGTVKISQSTGFGPTNGIHLVDDGLLLTGMTYSTVRWSQPVDDSAPMESELLYLPPFSFYSAKGKTGHYLANEMYMQHVTAEGEVTFYPYHLRGSDRRGNLLYMDHSFKKVQRFDPVEDVTTTFLDLTALEWNDVHLMLPVGDWLVFTYETNTSVPGIGRVRTDGSGLETLEVDDYPFQLLAVGSNGRAYARGASIDDVWKDGIWSFDPLASFEGVAPPDFRRDLAHAWNGIVLGSLVDSKGRLIAYHWASNLHLVEIDVERGFTRPLLEGGMVALEEDASGRLLVLLAHSDSFSPIDAESTRLELVYLYR